MSRGGFKITRCGDDHEAPARSVDSNVPSWMSGVAARAEEFVQEEEKRKEAVTVVDRARERRDSIHEQMHAIMNGKAPLYSSVEEAVEDYHKKTGLTEHLEKIQAEAALKEAADRIKAAGEDESAEKKTLENEKPVIFESHPEIAAYIDDIVRSNPSLSVPAAIHLIAENFEVDGVSSRELDDPILAKYINKLLIDSAPNNYEDYRGVGRDDGDSDFEQEEDAFGLLRPSGK